MNPDPTTAPTPRVSKITAARLHNLGNYEHVRYEITVEIPEGASASAAMADLENILGDLDPKQPVQDWNLNNARDALAKPASELSEHELGNIPAYRATVEKYEQWRKDQQAARAHLDAIGGSVSHVDAKDTWDNDH